MSQDATGRSPFSNSGPFASGLILELVVPVLVVWLGIRFIVQSNRRQGASC